VANEPSLSASAATPKLACLVLIPVGPGHETIVEQAAASVELAKAQGLGPFTQVDTLVLEDLKGECGRSRRRNDGVDYALAHGYDWIFFLDADDLMWGQAFQQAAPYVAQKDAIFGLIAEMVPENEENILLRANQLRSSESLADILRMDPFLTLQMGHFVRASAAATVRFDPAMNTGEDFQYYLELWRQFRCIKIDQILFVNRRGLHSTGPRAADGQAWRTAVDKVFVDFAQKHDLVQSFFCDGKQVRFAIPNPRDLIHQRLLSGVFFEAAELDYLRQIVPPQANILEVGANVGNHVVYYGLFLNPKSILPIEPNPEAVRWLEKNIELNGLHCVDLSLLGFGAGESVGKFDLHVDSLSNIGAAHLEASAKGTIDVYPLDQKVQTHIDLLKIDVEWMELEVLRGAQRLIRDSQPILFIEIMNANLEAFAAWREQNGYVLLKTFDYVNAKNYVAVPAAHPLARRPTA
jgi:FkbM family methyltransferase